MQAGKLRHRITIESPADTQGATFGEAKLTWSTFASVWAAVEPIGGKELLRADHVAGGLTHRVSLRYIAGVTAKMRINFNGRHLNIAAPPINKDERNIELELLCMEED